MSNRWPDKVIVGLTGNIATGKTTILRLAEEKSALALDADAFVHDILATDPEVQQAIVNAFGAGVRGPDGAIDRAAVAAIVFNEVKALTQLERILHPRVRRLLLRRIDRSTDDVVFIEAIKLLEGGLAEECDQIWVTRCPEEIQVQRLMSYRQLDEETALLRVRAQSSQDIKIAAADVTIDTGGSMDQTKAYFELAWARLQRRRSAVESSSGSAVPSPDPVREDDTYGQSIEAPTTENALVKAVRPSAPRNYESYGPDISVSRAQPSDIPAIIELVGRATHGLLVLEEDQLLADLGERGYLIGRQREVIRAVVGWNADNLVATIDSFYLYPPEALTVTGAAVLQEIETTANELTCEVIIALPGDHAPRGIRQLLAARGFELVDPDSLPRVWRAAVASARQPDTTVMMRVLRDTRQVRVRTMKEYHGKY